MLKLTRAIVIILIFIVFSGCNKNPLINETEQIIYQGILAEDAPAPFLLNNPKGRVKGQG